MMVRIIEPPFLADSGADWIFMNCCDVVDLSVGALSREGIVALCFRLSRRDGGGPD